MITISLDFTTRFNSDSLVSLLFSINGLLVIILTIQNGKVDE